MKAKDLFEGVMAQAANLGVERIIEFLSASRGMGSEAWERLADQAKVGAFAVGSKVRFEAAMNNRVELELRTKRLPPPQE